MTAAVADHLWDAAQTRIPCPPVRDRLTGGIDAAYAVQSELARRRLAGGAKVVGRKIGLTSPAVQSQLGVDQPDFGLLFDDMAFASGDVVPVATLLQPRIEAEIAFVLGADIDDHEADAASVRPAVDHAVAALEIVDSRVAGWDITIVDTIADNASSGSYVLSDVRVPLSGFEPRDVRMALTVGGQEKSAGVGRDCLGDPLAALAWLARTAVRFGEPLRAGQVVLSGALGPMVGVAAGDEVRAEITGLGAVAVSFD